MTDCTVQQHNDLDTNDRNIEPRKSEAEEGRYGYICKYISSKFKRPNIKKIL